MENTLLYSIIGAIIAIICVVLFAFIPFINRACVFRPYVADDSEMDALQNYYGKKIIRTSFPTKDGITLHGMLINTTREPSWNDLIFLYSHGNGGWIGALMESSTIKLLSKYGSVFVYDYRGYGLSNGTPSEEGLYTDITTAWNWLTVKKLIPHNRIIIFGHSLGASVSSYLVSKIINQSKNLPRALILEAPFVTMQQVADELMPTISFLLMYKFNNVSHLLNINGKIPVYILHSRDDKVIPYHHSNTLKDVCFSNNQLDKNSDLIEIGGSHNVPNYNNDVRVLLDRLSSN